MGKDLLALAVTGSFAMMSDQLYSDLDFIGFVRKPQGSDREVVNIIVDGLLIHLWFLTRQQYLYMHRQKVRAEWAYAGANTLVPLINEQFIRSLSTAPANTNPKHYRDAVQDLWPSFQEAAGKVLNAVKSGREDNVDYLYWVMVEKLSTVLALLNRKAFSTRSEVFSEARKFELLPVSFHALFEPIPDKSPELYAERVLTIFKDTETLLLDNGFVLYSRALDSFVMPLSASAKIRRRLWQNPIYSKLARGLHRIRNLRGANRSAQA
jgi:hypothetical protein